MQRHRRLLIVVADGEHARLLRPAHERTFEVYRELDSAYAHLRSADLGESRPGATFHSGSTAHHAIAPRSDPHQKAKVAFAHLIADELNRAAAADEYDELLIVAPARTMSALQKALHSDAETRIVGTLAKDLIKTPIRELWEQVAHWISAEHKLENHT